MAKAQLLGDPKQARELIRSVIEANPKHPGAWIFEGRLAGGEGERDAAIAAFQKALEFAPDHAAMHAQVAQLLVQLRAFDEAQQALVRAQSLGLPQAGAMIEKLQEIPQGRQEPPRRPPPK